MCYKFFFLILFLIQLIVTAQNTEIIHHKRQFRGVWIATVRNLDWPSKRSFLYDRFEPDQRGAHHRNGTDLLSGRGDHRTAIRGGTGCDARRLARSVSRRRRCVRRHAAGSCFTGIRRWFLFACTRRIDPSLSQVDRQSAASAGLEMV